MKCINKKRVVSVILCLTLAGGLLTGCSRGKQTLVTDFETENYDRDLYRGNLFAQNLCVTTGDVSLDGYMGDPEINSAGLFNLSTEEVVFGTQLFEQIYPASITKLMTAYITLKYGNLEDIVTVSEHAVDFTDPETQTCGLYAGDQISLYDLLCGLLLYSGNDAAIAIAEYFSGSEEAFVDRMNEEAVALGATHTHFMNPHGLHQEDHYSTAYDLYLIFQACLQDQRFLDIISMPSYVGTVTSSIGEISYLEWIPSNYYSAGLVEEPEGISVVGGKTGTTDEAGACVILYDISEQGTPYISIIMGAEDRDILYQDMSQLLSAGMRQ